MIRWLTLVLILWATPVYAQKQCPTQVYTDPDNPPDFNCPGPGEEELLPKLSLQSSVALGLGDQAPWAGVLMDKNRVFLLGLRVKALRRIRWEELMGYGEAMAAETEYLEQTKQATIDLLTSQRDSYKTQAESLRADVTRFNKWYRSPAVWFTVGFVLAAAGVTIVVVAVSD